VRSGSSGALAALYDRYRMRAYRVAYSVCEDTRRAEQAVAAAFGSIARVRSGGGHPSHGTIAASLLAEVNRRATDFAPGAGDLRHPLASLPRAEREAIVLAHYGVLSAAEIAAELEVPVDIVKGRLRSALEMLRDGEEPGSG
jgi:DNA-directed RNA polymerase specialized sigma24 family protein